MLTGSVPYSGLAAPFGHEKDCHLLPMPRVPSCRSSDILRNYWWAEVILKVPIQKFRKESLKDQDFP